MVSWRTVDNFAVHWLGRVSSRAQICPSFSSVVSICSLIHYLPRGCKYAERVSRSLILFALSSFLEDFIAFDAVNDDDQELDNLLVDLESLDREKMLSVSSRCYSYSSSSCKEVSHCLGDDLLDLDFDWIL